MTRHQGYHPVDKQHSPGGSLPPLFRAEPTPLRLKAPQGLSGGQWGSGLWLDTSRSELKQNPQPITSCVTWALLKLSGLVGLSIRWVGNDVGRARRCRQETPSPGPPHVLSPCWVPLGRPCRYKHTGGTVSAGQPGRDWLVPASLLRKAPLGEAGIPCHTLMGLG